MRKVLLTICLVLALLVSGCVGLEGRSNRENLPFLPNEVGVLPVFIPSICLVVKNINEINTIMEAEKKADAEFGQLKNPIYFVPPK